jgi:uncharacterized protein (DUF488 family)
LFFPPSSVPKDDIYAFLNKFRQTLKTIFENFSMQNHLDNSEVSWAVIQICVNKMGKNQKDIRTKNVSAMILRKKRHS